MRAATRLRLPPPGTAIRPDGVEFRVWAPHAKSLCVCLEGECRYPMQRSEDGVHEVFVPGLKAGARYVYELDEGRKRPDPASRLQEADVHGASTVVDLSFAWTDAGFRGVPLTSLVTYELHVGTFSPEGTLDSAIPALADLKNLGVTAVELMPLAAFDGPRGWGYDGVLPYSVHAAYGGPKALQRFVDAAHAHGLAVILDVVYNHFGPSGNYLREFGPYFTKKHHTPWGEAVNFDDDGSPFVRHFFIESAKSFVRDFHVDGLRLDAVHAIVDTSPTHLLEELNDEVQELARTLGRTVHVIAESDLNDPVIVRPENENGYGLASQWTDDFHHALHVALTGESQGYYADYKGMEDLARCFRGAFVYTGQASHHRGAPHGKDPGLLPGRRFTVSTQNHDQVGNRAAGDRLSTLVKPEALRLAATATLLSPFLPLLFMGEEYGETAPFQYFTSFPDEQLGRAVSEGRRKEFKAFAWKGEVPDPQDVRTFNRSRLDRSLAEKEPHAALRRLYKRLLQVRRSEPGLASDRVEDRAVTTDATTRTLLVRRTSGGSEALLVLHFSPETVEVALPLGVFETVIDTWDLEVGGMPDHALRPTLSSRIRLGPWHGVLLRKVG